MADDSYWVPAAHDDGRRFMVGPVNTEAGGRRLVSEIGQMGWHSGTPMRRMTRAAWFTMAYHERKSAIEQEQPAPGPAHLPAIPDDSPDGEPPVPRDPDKWWCGGEDCYGQVTGYPHVHTYPPRPLRAVDVTTGQECDIETAKARLAELTGKEKTDADAE